MKLFGTMKKTKNSLEIGGIDVKELKAKFQTPLYIMDEELIINTCKVFTKNFNSKNIKGTIAYASKAFLCKYMCKLIDKQGLSIDVASGGELYTAYKAGFPLEKVYFHGNNKTLEELELAIKLNIGNIVIDNENEIDKLINLLEKENKVMNVFFRVNLGIEADTHEYIKTATLDSKFGVSNNDPNIYNIIKKINDSKYLNLLGFHSHIGSQIFQEFSFIDACNEMLDFYEDIKNKLNIDLPKVNLGGGFGVYYNKEDDPFELENFLKKYINHIESEVIKRNLNIKEAIIEPGRSIVGTAGSTLYEIGGLKTTLSGKNYIFIDGGMADNPRYALYKAKYEAININKDFDSEKELYTVSGKMCESGDIIITDIELPKCEIGDLLLVKTTGAYNYTMSMNYNRLVTPGVVFVNNKKIKEAVRRKSYDDLILWDMEEE